MSSADVKKAEQDEDIRFVPTEKNTLSFSGAAHLSRYYWAKTFTRSSFECLDYGCGSGYGAYVLSHHVRQMDAVDISDNAINYAKSTYKRENLFFFRADLEKDLRLDKQYDLILSFDVVEHVEKPVLFFTNATKLLKRDGVFICGTPNRLQTLKWNREWNPYHKKEFTADELRNTLLAYYAVVEIRGQDIASKFQKQELQKNVAKRKSFGAKVMKTLRSLKNKIIFQRDISRHVRIDDIVFSGDAEESFGLIAICSQPKAII